MLSNELLEFYRSSPMREGVLCWYPFDKGANVLDLSGGALTPLLQSRCARVLTEGDEGFDYIVALDPKNFSQNALNALRTRLAPDGRLLLAYENPFALRYWSGKTCPVTNRPYDSLFGRDGRPGKAELSLRLNRAGFAGQKWYYPFPDHWFTMELYSEERLPDEYMSHRFAPYIDSGEYLQFDERPLYREVIKGGAFEFMCGAYLIEARTDAEAAPCPVDYAAITAYREPKNRFATTVRSDGEVHKTPLHPDGAESVKNISRNHGELARLGVNVVPVRLEGGALVMPRLPFPTLWDYWADKLTDGSFSIDKFILQFDKIRDIIHRASKNGTCYWELAPANCFYDEQNDDLIFFDQEYCWEGSPPEYALARAVGTLKFLSAFSSDLRSEAWIRELALRYGFGGGWEELFNEVISKAHAEVFGNGTAELKRVSAKAKKGIDDAWRKKKEKADDSAMSKPHAAGRREYKAAA